MNQTSAKNCPYSIHVVDISGFHDGAIVPQVSERQYMTSGLFYLKNLSSEFQRKRACSKEFVVFAWQVTYADKQIQSVKEAVAE